MSDLLQLEDLVAENVICTDNDVLLLFNTARAYLASQTRAPQPAVSVVDLKGLKREVINAFYSDRKLYKPDQSFSCDVIDYLASTGRIATAPVADVKTDYPEFYNATTEQALTGIETFFKQAKDQGCKLSYGVIQALIKQIRLNEQPATPQADQVLDLEEEISLLMDYAQEENTDMTKQELIDLVRRAVSKKEAIAGHDKFIAHLNNGGVLLRVDGLNKIVELIDINSLSGDANKIKAYGHDDLTCLDFKPTTLSHTKPVVNVEDARVAIINKPEEPTGNGQDGWSNYYSDITFYMRKHWPTIRALLEQAAKQEGADHD